MSELAPPEEVSKFLNAPLLENPAKPLNGRWALVTGATRMNGIGFGIAEQLALGGASVIIAGTERSREIAPYAIDRLKAYGVGAEYMVGDLSDESWCNELITDAFDIGGRDFDILVNNAGTNLNKPVTDVSLEDYHYVYDPKAIGAFLISKEWFSYKNRKNWRGGSVVNIGSPVGSMYSNYGQLPYSMANGALFGLTQGLALEFGTRKINVNLVAPTFVEGTEITKDMDEARINQIRATTPGGELPTPQEIGAAAAFLVGPMARHITGTILPIDSGMKSNYTALQSLEKARLLAK